MTGHGERDFFRSPAVIAGSAAFLLGVSGVLTIASSRSGGFPDILFVKQTLFLLLGLGLMLLAASPEFAFYRTHAVFWGGIGLSLILILPWCGVRINGMCGWFRVGGVSMQPSELMKAPYLLVLSVILAQRDGSEAQRFRRGLCWALAWTLPVALQPDLGTAAIYFGAFMLLYFAAAGSPWYLLIPVFAGLPVAVFFIWRHPYIWQRLCGFFDPAGDPLGSGWHTRQFELAIARGHYFGAKLGGALWSGNYLPFAYNDSAFATLMETLGLVGGMLVGALFAALAAALLRLASGAFPAENRIFIVGAVLLLLLQSMIHISVNLCLVPTTGLTLPFVSYGGSSLLGCFLLLGMALSAGKKTGKDG